MKVHDIMHLRTDNGFIFVLQWTSYGLHGPGSNPGGSEIFRIRPDRPWGQTSLLYNGYLVFPGGKEWPGGDADTSPLSSAVIKNE